MICSSYLDGSAPASCLSTPCPLGQLKDPCGVCGGDGAKDVCGSCMSRSSPAFNKSCLGCDGVPFSLKTTDDCGICDFPWGDSRRTNKECVTTSQQEATDSGMSHGVLIAVVILLIVTTGGAVWWFMRRRERAMRRDIDQLLKNYLPLDVINS